MGERTLETIAVDQGLVGGPFGSNLVGKDYTDDGIPVIRGTNMTGPYVGGEFAYVSQEKFTKDLPRNSARPGDLIFTQRGTLGQVATVPPGPVDEYVISQSQMRLRVDDTKADSRFVYFACSSPSFLKQVGDNAISTGVPHINLSILSRLTIPDLPLRRQRAIAEVLGALDDKIATNDRIATTAKALLATRFAKLGIDVAAHDSDTTVLSELIELNPRLPAPTAAEPAYLDMKSLPNEAMTVTSWGYRISRGGARFQNGDTLLARITPCLENGKVGFVDFLNRDEVGIGSTEYIVMRARNNVPRVLPYFLATSPRFREFAVRHMVGTSGRQRLAASDLSDFRFQRPDPHELVEFGRISGSLMPRVKSAVDESRALTTTRDELLPLLMSGKVRVRDAEKPVEEVV